MNLKDHRIADPLHEKVEEEAIKALNRTHPELHSEHWLLLSYTQKEHRFDTAVLVDKLDRNVAVKVETVALESESSDPYRAEIRFLRDGRPAGPWHELPVRGSIRYWELDGFQQAFAAYFGFDSDLLMDEERA